MAACVRSLHAERASQLLAVDLAGVIVPTDTVTSSFCSAVRLLHAAAAAVAHAARTLTSPCAHTAACSLSSSFEIFIFHYYEPTFLLWAQPH